MFYGSIPALITPFKNGTIDWDAFDQFIEWQISQGSHGVVACGTTGESPTLSPSEHVDIIKRCVAVVKGRVPVIAGTGSNCTSKTIEMTQKAKELGVDAALIVTPYYNKPTQEGIFAHFKAINDSVALPILVYNIPGRSIVDISNQTMGRLAGLPHIAGVKDASADLSRPALLKQICGSEFVLLSGEDGTTAGYLAQGGHGCISVTANIAPAQCAALYEAHKNGNRDELVRLIDLLAPLHEALFYESSPAPVKYAAMRLGLCQNELRLPLLTATQACQDYLEQIMLQTGLLEGEDKAYG
jgi:4-hydroxy-tetrahydrodipicolinate synthase